MAYYLAPRFLNKLAVHITKNYLDLPQVKVPLILGIHGRKGEGKTFQCELVFKQMGVEVVHLSGGELESPDAGDPARLIRLRYREAAELVRVRGCMAVLMINDLDAGAGRFDRMTQYTVNTQLVNNTLMNIADNPTNVQLPGSYDDKVLPRIPIIATGNDFATLYAPLIRDGRMQKFYWEPDAAERLGMVQGLFAGDGLSAGEVEQLVSHFRDQAIDFFGAVRSQVYDEQIANFIHRVGIDQVASQVVNTLQMPTFEKPQFQLDHLIDIGSRLVAEQARIQALGLVSQYNQALTPPRLQEATKPTLIENSDTALLTPPPHNPLTPYLAAPRLSRRDAQLAETSLNGSRANYKQGGFPPTLGSATEPSMSQPPGKRGLEKNPYLQSSELTDHPERMIAALSLETQQWLHQQLLQGHRLGVEHADVRRFRANSWQPYPMLNTSNPDLAAQQLVACLSEFPDHYVRLIAIDRHNHQRLGEAVVQRPAV